MADDDGRMFGESFAGYSEPNRAYHNEQHISDCLQQLDDAADLAERPDEVELAIWFHDLIYDTHRSDNESQSVDRAAAILHESDYHSEVIERVVANILATTHQATPEGLDEQLTVDIDLSILGRSQKEYDRFEAAIRTEYRWVPSFMFKRRRRSILKTFLKGDRNYATDQFTQRFESNARENLRRAIDQLS